MEKRGVFMRKISIGIIGFGGAGVNIHLPIINATGLYEVKAVNTTNPERIAYAKKMGYACYATPEELLQKADVELVAIVTPHDTHLPLAVKALAAGKHVITDKLMCLNAAEAKQMIASARQAGKMLTVFHNRRWDWDFLSVQDYLARHEIGRIRLVKESVYLEKDLDGWKWRCQRAHGGGMMSDWGAHMMDHALCLMAGQRVTSVACQTQYASENPDIDVETWGMITIGFENGTKYQVETLVNAGRAQKRLDVFGDRYAIGVSGFDPQEEQVNRGSWLPGLTGAAPCVYGANGEQTAAPALAGAWNAFYINVAEHLTAGKELAVKPEQALRMMQVLDAAFRSEREKREIAVEI